LGFAIVIVPMRCSIYYSSPQLPTPMFHWATKTFFVTQSTPQLIATNESIRTAGAILLATIAGFIGAYIYDQTRKADDA
jgi:hypothetical protein